VGLVGISCWTSLHYWGAVAVARRVRELAPSLPIVIGGHHPTGLPTDFTDASLCDWVVVGDGEHPLRKLCETWPARPPATEILLGTAFAPPDPGRHIDWVSYPRDGRAVWVTLTRGCPFQCSFCVEPERGPARLVGYTVADALLLMEKLAQTHTNTVICFTDPLFAANRSWAEEFLVGLEARQLPLMFWAETRADLMTPAMLERLLRCNFKVDFGLETGSLTMVERMRKAQNPEAYLRRSREMLLQANRMHLHHDVYLLFNAPGETPDTAAETRAFVESLDAGNVACWVSSGTFFILPGTESYRRMEELRARWGTEIRHPRWWREEGDAHAMATDVLPSDAWRGREGELRSYQQWQNDLNMKWFKRYRPEIYQFRMRFFAP
jgi:anaerobic magnesium-protoporphyrin IX monomethyl ester cyclase